MDLIIRFLTAIAWIWVFFTVLLSLGTWLHLSDSSYRLDEKSAAIKPFLFGLPAWVWLFIRYLS
jgi:hypothetical protein